MQTWPWKDNKVPPDAVEEEEARVLREGTSLSVKEDNLTLSPLLAVLEVQKTTSNSQIRTSSKTTQRLLAKLQRAMGILPPCLGMPACAPVLSVIASSLEVTTVSPKRQ